MAKGFNANRERLEQVSLFGKQLAKRAGFACEWCGDKNDLKPWEHKPEREPELESLALLCGECRGLTGGRKPDGNELNSIRNALWSDVPAVAEGVARVMARSRESWVREAIEDSLIDDEVKRELLAAM